MKKYQFIVNIYQPSTDTTYFESILYTYKMYKILDLWYNCDKHMTNLNTDNNPCFYSFFCFEMELFSRIRLQTGQYLWNCWNSLFTSDFSIYLVGTICNGLPQPLMREVTSQPTHTLDCEKNLFYSKSLNPPGKDCSQIWHLFFMLGAYAINAKSK